MGPDVAASTDSHACEPTVDLLAVYQAEDDKSILQRGLEDLLRAPVVKDTTYPFCSHLLERYFKISSGQFRPHQQEVCLSVLQGVNTLAVCPTGWGKSLCYQFPMLVHRLLFVARRQAWEATRRQDGSLRSSAATEAPLDAQSKFCVVVSPLLSLMADQMDKIRDNGCLKAITISSQVTAEREASLLKALASPTSDVDILFTSPEKYLGSVALRQLLQTHSHRLAMVCVDEVHCVSRWAFDFRPSFMYVSRVLADALPPLQRTHVPFLCLTATATTAVVRDIQRDFQIERTISAADQFRANLQLASVDLVRAQNGQPAHSSSVAPQPKCVHPPSQRAIEEALLEAVREMPKPMIVYVHSRADADVLSTFLAAKLGGGASSHSTCAAATGRGASKMASSRGHGVFSSVSAAGGRRGGPAANADPLESNDHGRPLVIRCYHAALSRPLRTATQQQFTKGSIDVLVATVAFGMGIDKANIRSIVHAYAPSSLESYVQEIGRSGRDGLPSFCRVLYNPFDFYSLRCRALASLVSPQEVRAVVQCIFRSPVTVHGDKLLLVCPYKIAEELVIAEETVETLLFMTLTGAHQSGSGGKEGLAAPVFRKIRGSCPIGFKVVEVAGEGGDGSEEKTGGDPPRRSSQVPRGRKQAKREFSGLGNACGQDSLAHTGVASLLAQLNARDPVLEVFRGRRILENQVSAVNEARVSWDDFQFRVRDLQDSGVLKLSRLSASPAYLLEVGGGFEEAACPAGQVALSEALFSAYNERLLAQTGALHSMFRVLAHPSHEAIQKALEEHGSGRPAATCDDSWSPPPRSLTKMEAVSIANDFVLKNGLRLRSSYEAARCLLGIKPKSLIKHGKYAGDIPLALSWYVRSPYFGTLREFDVDWVLAVLKPHHLDDEQPL